MWPKSLKTKEKKTKKKKKQKKIPFGLRNCNILHKLFSYVYNVWYIYISIYRSIFSID